ncbi:hypothetical protein [Aquisalibacillus elongatus]|uniref:Uncharacterized protein n=1 Tax=Aquisalibacillus elongatus TaxID=485577 RepID=A0A3N5BRL6_9BACI|nr:hypothetical protein [Aquisalibacillus elongatus]RPF50152.1 hypothetical protein EDC24_2970 [Aquisalibacillus elongatus]
MAKPGNRDEDSRSKYDLDVDRMLNEGLAGGYVRPTYSQVQIGETHEIRKNDEPFSPTKRETPDDE